jgi:hypothetical protein
MDLRGCGCVEGSSDRAFGGRENVPTFNLVIDAGCGDVVQVWLENSFEANVSEYLIGAGRLAIE